MRLSIPSLSALAATLLLAACGSSTSSSSSSTAVPSAAASPTSAATTVRTAANSTVGTTVLVTTRGMTLYRLSGESSGHFICVHACLAIWHPLTVSAGSRPQSSVGGLGVITRPGVGEQVTYHGMPLYTFVQDRTAGQAKGQGLKDVGTWNAVSTAGQSKPKAPTSTSSSGGGYAY